MKWAWLKIYRLKIDLISKEKHWGWIVWKFRIFFRLDIDGINLVEDTDVADERHRIQNENNFILRIENLTKYFRKAFGENLAAVNGVSVGIKSGEVC